VSSNVDSLIVLGDGKVGYVTGLLLPMRLPNGQPQRSDAAVYRFNNGGTTHTKFGADGNVQVRIGSWDSGGAQINSALNALAVTQDDALLVLSSCLPTTPAGPVIQPCRAKLGGGPLDCTRCSADIDRDGVIASAIDSVLLAHVALGFKDSALIQGLTFSLGANRTS
jgi:hypothetical protein